jgi:hypothetical protein
MTKPYWVKNYRDPLDMTKKEMEEDKAQIISNFTQQYNIPLEDAIRSAQCWEEAVISTRNYMKGFRRALRRAC